MLMNIKVDKDYQLNPVIETPDGFYFNRMYYQDGINIKPFSEFPLSKCGSSFFFIS